MILYGRNSVSEFLESCPEMIEHLYILRGVKKKDLSRIASLAGRNNLELTELPRQEMDKLCKATKHQGVAAAIRQYSYSDLEAIISGSKNRSSCSRVLLLDHLEDPQNFGAILRTSGFFNIDGVVIPKDRAVHVTPAVVKVSAGAVSSVPVARVTNLSDVVRKLKDRGYWIIGSDVREGRHLSDLDINDLDVAIILGSESSGVSPNLRKLCDFIVHINGYGKTESLNVSVAAGILLYELTRSVKVN